MPNDVKNRLIIKSKKEKQEDILEYIKGEKGEVIDFNKIIPQPKNIFHGDLFDREERRCRENNIPTWYDWNKANWGSKWGAYNTLKSGDNSIWYKTAWNNSLYVIKVLSLIFKGVEFEYTWSDEDAAYNLGKVVLLDGNIVEEYIPIEGSKEAYELYFELHDGDRKNFVLENGNYKYIGD